MNTNANSFENSEIFPLGKRKGRAEGEEGVIVANLVPLLFGTKVPRILRLPL